MASDQNSFRRCISCGRTIGWDANLCQYCGYDYRYPRGVVPPVPQQARAKDNTALIVAVVVVSIIVVLSIVLAVIALSPRADLQADLMFSAANDWAGASTSGSISVFGTIYNYGDKMGEGTVHLHVYDGYEWHDYYEATGPIPANSSVGFFWADNFDPMNEYNVVVEYSL